MKRSLKPLDAVLLGALTLSFLTACGGGSDEPSADGLETMQVMMFPGQVSRIPILVGEHEGYFAEQGLKVSMVAQPAQLTGVQGLEATKSQAAPLSVSTLVQGWQAGSDLVFFCGSGKVLQTSLMVAPDSKLPTVESGATWQEALQSLEGKKIGIQTPVGSGLQLLFAAALEEAGVEDVTYVNLGTQAPVIQAALANGSVDVAQTNPTATQQLVTTDAAKPLAYLADGPSVYKDYVGTGWAASKKWVDANPEAAAGFCEASKQALAYMSDEANADVVESLVEKDAGVSKEVAGLVRTDVFTGYSTDIDQASMERTLDGYVDLGVSKASPLPTFDALVVDPKS